MIVVTTPTGTIGRQVVANLLNANADVRVIVRDPARLSPQVRDRVEVVPGSHGDPEVVTKAFAGAEAVFWLVPPNFQTPTLDAAYAGFARPACAAIVSEGVQRVVGVSAVGRGHAMAANAGLVTASLAMDDLIASTGVGYRALAMPSFMDNVLWQVADLKRDGVYSSPVPGDIKAPTCATRDIAAVAADLLLDTSWSGDGTVAVPGPDDLSAQDMAAIMSEVLDRPIRFQHVDRDSYTAGLVARGTSEAMVRGMVDMVVAMENGLFGVGPDVSRAVSPTTFRQWCEEVLRPAVTAA
nr:NAD(P)H-binding protein [Kibdelosporangium sp. MJ126-NF4]CEL18641.1 conserved hypothetical protein [Kibdelosporangium sp. MJ126-NF4]CTQ98125.1 conserved hypothetical protein [Kibdelosporangium sp. MJ126-NF4]